MVSLLRSFRIDIEPDPLDDCWWSVSYKGNCYYVTDDPNAAIDEAYLLYLKVKNRKEII